MSGAFGSGGFGSSPYGSVLGEFGVSSAIATNSTHVQVFFSDAINPGYGPLLSTSNYTITPPLSVLGVEVSGANSVRLRTGAQAATLYQVEVTDARSYDGRALGTARTAVFEGVPSNATFFAVATIRRRLRLIFSETLRNDAELIDPTNYTLTDLDGSGSTLVLEVVRELPYLLSVDIVLDTDFQAGHFYKIEVSSFVRAASGAAISPATALFQFIETATQSGLLPLTVSINAFSGEVVGDPMLGTPPGLIFFSPALEQSASNSVIQVDEVYVCTKAYDEYVIPTPPDPPVFYVYGGGHAEGLGLGALWAPFPRLVEARFELEDHQVDAIPAPVDSRCIATFTEPWDITYVSLLNNTYWKVFDNGVTPPAYFITANNLAPIPPGPTVVRVLQP